MRGLQVPFLLRIPGQCIGWTGITGHQPQALSPGGEP
jgi:hypothetical protein